MGGTEETAVVMSSCSEQAQIRAISQESIKQMNMVFSYNVNKYN